MQLALTLIVRVLVSPMSWSGSYKLKQYAKIKTLQTKINKNYTINRFQDFYLGVQHIWVQDDPLFFCFHCFIPTPVHALPLPFPRLYNIRVMVIVWRLRGNIIRTALCWVVWHNVHSRQHTYMSSSYRSSRLGLSHWDPYAMRRGGCLELYYCNAVAWSWWDSSLIWKTNWFPAVLWHCWFGHMTCKIVPDMTYNVFDGTLNLAQSIDHALPGLSRCVSVPMGPVL